MTTEEKMQLLKELHAKTKNYFIKEYMNPDSPYLLDEKIQVLEDLEKGMNPPSIPHYDDVMDAYPQDTTHPLESGNIEAIEEGKNS